MDAGAVIKAARWQAELSKTALAARAGTSSAAVLAYETGRRSPTVDTLNRLLAACGLQLRGDLELLHADVDAAVDAALAGAPVGADYNTVGVVRAFAASSVSWALDGRWALVAHGLAVDPPFGTELAVVDGPELRDLLADLWATARDRDGLPFYENWDDLDLGRLSPAPMWTRAGFVLLRVVEDTSGAVSVSMPVAPPGEGELPCRVLGLLDVERAHPALAQLLARLRERRTVCA